MSFVLANGIKIHYQEMGQGQPVILLHGLLIDNLALWYFTAGQIIKNRHRALMYDLRGHGKSEQVTRGFDLATLSHDLSCFVEELTPGDDIDLCGFSYGGLVAIRYALTYPERVRRLVLVDAPLPPLKFDPNHWLRADRDTLIAALPEAIRNSVLQAPGLALKLLQRTSFLALRTTMIHDLKHEPPIAINALNGLNIPVLCIYGDRSEFRADGEWLAAAFPDAHLRIVSGSHRLLNECALAVTALVEEFLNG